ncbi:MAG: flagellar hook-length control protein FliK [Planctomycetaceae bacterium]|nr:flagellar hook-length control protein FliK [Planctomycetaceae bacterium]
MDVLDRSPRLDFFPVSPPPANASPLDPATSPPVTGDFAQAMALAPTEASSVTTTVAVTPVVVEPLPPLPGDVPVAVEFDPTGVLTAYIQYRAPQLPAAEEVADPLAGENPSTVVTNLNESSIPAVAIPPVILPNVIPIGLSQGLTIDTPLREAVATTSVTEGDTNFVAPVTSFIISTLPAPALMVPTRPAPQTTPSAPGNAAHADETDEPPADTPLVAPSFVVLTIPQAPPVAPAPSPQTTPQPRSILAGPRVVPPTKPVAEAAVPRVVPVIPGVLANESTIAAPGVTPLDSASRVASTVNTAATVEPASPVTVPAPLSAESPPSALAAPIPTSLHAQSVETSIPRDVPIRVAQSPQVADTERIVPDTAPGPQGTSASLPQPSVRANSTPIIPSAPPQPTAVRRSPPLQTQPEEATSAETVPSTSAVPPNAFSPMTPMNLAPSAAASVTPSAPSSSRAISTPAVTPPAIPSTENTAVPTAVVTDDPSPVTVPTTTNSGTGSVATTETDEEISGKPSGPKIAAVHDRKMSSTPTDVSDSGHLKPQPDLKATEPISTREESRAEQVVPATPRSAEPVMAAAPALDFGDPVPIHEARQVVQRLGDAIGLAHESGQHLSIRVTPPQFGPIVVNVHMHEGTMSARVETHSALAQQMLTDHLPQLHESLSARGAMIDRIDIVPVESRTGERSARVDEVSTETTANGWMSSETPGRQGYDPQDSSRRRPPRPLAIKPVVEAAAIEPAATTRPVQLQELNVRV